MDGKEYNAKRDHPHQVRSGYRAEGTSRFGTQARESLVRRQVEACIRVSRRFGCIITGTRSLEGRHEHAPTGCNDVGPDDKSNGIRKTDDSAEIQKKGGTSEVDQPIHRGGYAPRPV